MKFSKAAQTTRLIIVPDGVPICFFRCIVGKRLPRPCLLQFGPYGGDDGQSEVTLHSIFRMWVGRVIGRKRLKVTTRAPNFGKGSAPAKIRT